MAESIFGDKSEYPTVPELEKTLGKSDASLKDIEMYLMDQTGWIEREWRFYSKKAGWTFALINDGRRLMHVIPRSGFFTTVITLGKKAGEAAKHDGLSRQILSAIENAQEYAEGKSIRLDIYSEKDVDPVKQLMRIKMLK